MKRDDDLYKLYVAAKVKPQWAAILGSVISTIKVNKGRYLSVAAKSGVPWQVIAALHWMESSGNFDCHLHNGDSLKARTRRVPAGRPKTGKPPFTWEDSALDALEYDGLTRHPWKGPGGITMDLLKIEMFNGPGYKNRRLNSPYLWSGTQFYDYGKYVGDGRWSSTAVSKQLGAALILRGLGY